MAIKLHTCGNPWVPLGHPCHRVKKALDDQGVDYELVKHPSFPRGRRDELEQLSGQRLLPVIEHEDGTIYREESGDMARRVRDGRLFESSTAATT